MSTMQDTPSCAHDETMKPPFPQEQVAPPGKTHEMDPKPDHGEESYQGSNKLMDKVAVITGGDSGIGRAVAIAFAREGADVVITYHESHEDAEETARWVQKAGRRALCLAGDIGTPEHCREIVNRTMREFGHLDVLVNNAAKQRNHDTLDEMTIEEWDSIFKTNIHSMFYLVKEAVPHMPRDSSIINTTSIQSKKPTPSLLAYATTKGAINNFTTGLSQLLAEKGIRVNAVAPGPIWTPLIPSTLPPEKTQNFGKQTPMKRPGQPAELAPAYVYFASNRDSSYVTGAILPVTGGMPFM